MRSKFFLFSLDFSLFMAENVILLLNSKLDSYFKFKFPFCYRGGVLYFKRSFALNAIFGLILRQLCNSIRGYSVEIVIKSYFFTVRKLRHRFMFFDVGFSHFFILKIPETVFIRKYKYHMLVFGFDKKILSDFLYVLCNIRKINPYTGKGIYRSDFHYKLKEGKKR